MNATGQSWLRILSLAGCAGALAACSSRPLLEPAPPRPEPTAAETPGAVSPAAEPVPEPKTAATSSATANQQSVKVFFPKPLPGQAAYVEPVWRATASSGVARFAIAQLFAGPSEREADLGLQPLPSLVGASNCGGEDFQIAIASGRAELQLCRDLAARDAVDLTRLHSAIAATLTQFPTVKQVALRDRQGRCLSPEGCGLAAAKQDTPAALSQDSRLTLTSLGPIELGMTLDAAAQAANLRFVQEASGGEEYGCLYFRPQGGPEGVALMVIDGKIARIDIDSAQIATLSGIRIGDSAAAVRRAYGDRLEAQPHEYVPGGQYLIFVPAEAANQDYRLVLETDASGRVTRMRNGLAGAALAVEGCV